jgi:chromosome segregation ATPase
MASEMAARQRSGAAEEPLLEQQRALIAELGGRVEALASSERELHRLLNEAHAQVGARDAEIARLLQELSETRTEHARVLREATFAHGQIAEMRRTRVWRAGRLWWSVRDRLLGRGR